MKGFGQNRNQQNTRKIINTIPDEKKLIADARRKLASAIDTKASSINELYIDPPKTAPFGVVYLPTESLFFEACNYRDPKTKEPFIHTLYREYNINILGPTTLSVFLQTLQKKIETNRQQEEAKASIEANNHDCVIPLIFCFFFIQHI